MNYTTVKATKPGSPPAKLEKRTGDSKIFLLDCGDLLSQGEMVMGVPTAAVKDLVISEVRTRQGRYVQFRAAGGPVGMPFVDYHIKFVVATTLDNTLSVPVVLKVYAD